MNIFKSMVIFLLIILLLIGCRTAEPEPEKLRDMSLEDIKNNIKNGLTKTEVENILGGPTGIVEENSLPDVPDNPEYWRYDFPKGDYSFNPETADEIDKAGLLNGKMRMQLRLAWSSGFINQRVAQVSIFYKENDSLYWYTEDNLSVYDSKKDKFIDIKKK